MFLQLLAILGSVLGFVGITLAIASGLYYLSEIIEENLELTRRFLDKTIKIISVFLVLLCFFDDLPFKYVLLSLVTNFAYYKNLNNFPNLKLTSVNFLISLTLTILNHFAWFHHFNNPYIPTIDERLKPGFKMPHYPNFTEISSFFGLMIWFIPFSFFISLSSNDINLPTTMDRKEDDDKKSSSNLVKYGMQVFYNKLVQALALLGIKLKKKDSANPNEMII
ncbi:unnamed protein product [Ambrosiozyma monospora]|uniref:Unnamed protein product n=1 Tax=Ambrosiozyma monospora TaxID=43982 RepID=A0ACB5T6C7_AMBMO|nr:unnamed protein product [Ambrosiozyma monospora]